MVFHCHLSLIDLQDETTCALRVVYEIRNWKEGELHVFHESLENERRNDNKEN